MDSSFWLQRWETNNIGFHRSEANPILVEYFKALSLEKDSRIFVPLCGKTLDIAWLLSNGYQVAGAELIAMAIEQLFMELKVEPKISDVGEVKHYSATNIDIFVGDIFDVSHKILGPVDAIYDRAALVALPGEMRNRYTAHLIEITDKAPQLLVSYEYDQNLMSGPPFSVSNKEVDKHYRESYDLTLVRSEDVPGRLKGKCAAKENIWLLKIN
ncbi:MAG: thiopurine S-methyltransferase [Leptolyngbya sp. SIO1D8]|nr:thiopurine S-methyltransferase [Leptolyngbya sp. SIO1D8]